MEAWTFAKFVRYMINRTSCISFAKIEVNSFWLKTGAKFSSFLKALPTFWSNLSRFPSF